MRLRTYKTFVLEFCDLDGEWLTRLSDGEGRFTNWRGPYPSRAAADHAAERFADRLARPKLADAAA